MNKLQLAKNVTSVIVGFGTTKIVGTIIRNNVAAESLTDKVTVTAGTYVLGAMVADLSKRYTDAKIDEVAAWYKANVKK